MAHIIPESDVIGIEILAVGPFHALSEMKSPYGILVVVLKLLDDIRIVGTVGIVADNALQNRPGQAPAAACAAKVDDAAVSTDLQSVSGCILGINEHIVLNRNALLHCGQGSCAYQFGKSGGLAERGRLSRGGTFLRRGFRGSFRRGFLRG